MPLPGGVRFGPYEVVGMIGAGGMGEVYRARDTKLGRDVALKILPDAFAHDPERLARFQREARTLASLNHPNIAQIYGLEESPAGRAIVLEFVDGRCLEKDQRNRLSSIRDARLELDEPEDARLLVFPPAGPSVVDVIEGGAVRIGAFNRVLEQLKGKSIEAGNTTGDFGRSLLALREERQSRLSITLATGWAEALTKR